LIYNDLIGEYNLALLKYTSDTQLIPSLAGTLPIDNPTPFYAVTLLTLISYVQFLGVIYCCLISS